MRLLIFAVIVSLLFISKATSEVLTIILNDPTMTYPEFVVTATGTGQPPFVATGVMNGTSTPISYSPPAPTFEATIIPFSGPPALIDSVVCVTGPNPPFSSVDNTIDFSAFNMDDTCTVTFSVAPPTTAAPTTPPTTGVPTTPPTTMPPTTAAPTTPPTTAAPSSSFIQFELQDDLDSDNPVFVQVLNATLNGTILLRDPTEPMKVFANMPPSATYAFLISTTFVDITNVTCDTGSFAFDQVTGVLVLQYVSGTGATCVINAATVSGVIFEVVETPPANSIVSVNQLMPSDFRILMDPANPMGTFQPPVPGTYVYVIPNIATQNITNIECTSSSATFFVNMTAQRVNVELLDPSDLVICTIEVGVVGPTTAPTTFAPTLPPTTTSPTGTTPPVTSPPTTGAPTAPTAAPTDAPTAAPTDAPTAAPTDAPAAPTGAPTAPTDAPTGVPTGAPAAPTDAPAAPTGAPTAPTDAPTGAPTGAPAAPTDAPTGAPAAPTDAPTGVPAAPTDAPTGAPTAPTDAPTGSAIGITATSIQLSGAPQSFAIIEVDAFGISLPGALHSPPMESTLFSGFPAGDYYLLGFVPFGWVIVDITCTDPMAGINVVQGSVNITFDGSTPVECTWSYAESATTSAPTTMAPSTTIPTTTPPTTTAPTLPVGLEIMSVQTSGPSFVIFFQEMSSLFAPFSLPSPSGTMLFSNATTASHTFIASLPTSLEVLNITCLFPGATVDLVSGSVTIPFTAGSYQKCTFFYGAITPTTALPTTAPTTGAPTSAPTSGVTPTNPPVTSPPVTAPPTTIVPVGDEVTVGIKEQDGPGATGWFLQETSNNFPPSFFGTGAGTFYRTYPGVVGNWTILASGPPDMTVLNATCEGVSSVFDSISQSLTFVYSSGLVNCTFCVGNLPTVPPTTIAPTTAPTTANPVTLPPTTPPVTATPTTPPTTPPVTLPPTTPPVTATPTTPPTTPPVTATPTTPPTTPPVTATPTTPPTTPPTTMPPTTLSPTTPPTTPPTTLNPVTTPPVTTPPTTAVPTMADTALIAVQLKIEPDGLDSTLVPFTSSLGSFTLDDVASDNQILTTTVPTTFTVKPTIPAGFVIEDITCLDSRNADFPGTIDLTTGNVTTPLNFNNQVLICTYCLVSESCSVSFVLDTDVDHSFPVQFVSSTSGTSTFELSQALPTHTVLNAGSGTGTALVQTGPGETLVVNCYLTNPSGDLVTTSSFFSFILNSNSNVLCKITVSAPCDPTSCLALVVEPFLLVPPQQAAFAVASLNSTFNTGANFGAVGQAMINTLPPGEYIDITPFNAILTTPGCVHSDPDAYLSSDTFYVGLGDLVICDYVAN